MTMEEAVDVILALVERRAVPRSIAARLAATARER